ncbi:hypothetical protein P20652_2661 [Pseudoalteromonas sp. BSi20652]|nr:hypothetical protein P20652_2661 [Pseudoalteromonas sp. BSi20652]
MPPYKLGGIFLSFINLYSIHFNFTTSFILNNMINIGLVHKALALCAKTQIMKGLITG